MSSVKFDIEKFDGRINFGLWQVQARDVLIQSGLHKVLKGRPTPVSSTTGESSKSKMSDEDWEELDLKAASTIRLCLAKNVLANVNGISTAKGIWEKLEELYQKKGVSNRVYLKEQFHTLRMDEGMKISDHLSVLNSIVSELEAIGVKVEEEDIALRLIWSLPSSYEHMKPILLHGNEELVLSEVTSKLFSEEKRLTSGNHSSSGDSAYVSVVSGKKKNFKKKEVVCWKCGQSGHLKKNCQNGGASSAGNSKSVHENTDGTANSVSLCAMGDDFIL